jgi:hypothetical protein
MLESGTVNSDGGQAAAALPRYLLLVNSYLLCELFSRLEAAPTNNE